MCAEIFYVIFFFSLYAAPLLFGRRGWVVETRTHISDDGKKKDASLGAEGGLVFFFDAMQSNSVIYADDDGPPQV